MSNMLDGRGDGVLGGEQRVHNDVEVLYLKVDLVQGLKGVSIIEVMIKEHDKVWLSDGDDKNRMVNRGGE